MGLVTQLQGQVAQLTAAKEELHKQVAELKRAGKRQAAPFSKGGRSSVAVAESVGYELLRLTERSEWVGVVGSGIREGGSGLGAAARVRNGLAGRKTGCVAPSRSRHEVAAVALLLGGVHGGGTGQAQGTQPQGPARNLVLVRLGTLPGTGARGGTGRRGTLTAQEGEVAADVAATSPGFPCIAAFGSVMVGFHCIDAPGTSWPDAIYFAVTRFSSSQASDTACWSLSASARHLGSSMSTSSQ